MCVGSSSMSNMFFFFFNPSEVGGYCGVFTGIRETRLRTPLPLQLN